MEKYGKELGVRPVGSGPFRLISYDTARIVMERNPNYRQEPVDLVAEDDFALPFAVARRRAQARFERAYVERLLAKHGGSVTQAARESGIAARYFRIVKARNFPT